MGGMPLLFSGIALCFAFACAASPPFVAAPSGSSEVLAVQEGMATYYSDALAGRSTASGEPYKVSGYTAAHKTLPFGTVVRVTHRVSGASVKVRVNDRGPFGERRRIIDLAKVAAKDLGILREGVAPVRVEVLFYGPASKRR